MAQINPLRASEFIRFWWRKLTSMRTAIILLIILAIASIPGSLFPQRTQNPLKVDQYFSTHKSWAKFLNNIGFFNVYSSPWFSAIYILLFISLIGCVVPRALLHYRKISKLKRREAIRESGNLLFHLSLILPMIPTLNAARFLAQEEPRCFRHSMFRVVERYSCIENIATSNTKQ